MSISEQFGGKHQTDNCQYQISDWIQSYACHLQAVIRVLKQRLLDEDEVVHVRPLQLYHDNPGFGVRDVANNVIRLLRKVIKLPMLVLGSDKHFKY